MSETEHDSQESLVECEVCLKEIPTSAAKHDETSDYVRHFCGIECYAKWKQIADQQEQQGN